jgi:hypothetical protein
MKMPARQFTYASSLLVIFVLLLCTPFYLNGEGTVQLNPNGTAGDPCADPTVDVGDLAMLGIRSTNANFPDFAIYGSYGGTNSLCFEIKDPKEVVYIALSGEAAAGGECAGGYTWRIFGPSGVAHGPFVLTDANSNGNDFGDLLAGPDVFNAAGYSTAGEYTFQPTEPGLYCFEIDPTTVAANSHVRNFDFTVADCPGAAGNIIPGRIFSQNWKIRTPCISTIISCDEDPAVTSQFAGFQPFQNPFDGDIYVLTEDNFVQFVDFGSFPFGQGFRGLTFNLSFNITGPGNTGDVIMDRQSKDQQNGTFLNPDLFPVFLNPPDPNCFEEGMCGDITFAMYRNRNNRTWLGRSFY